MQSPLGFVDFGMPLLLLLFALSALAQAPNHAAHMLEGAFNKASCPTCSKKPRIGIMIDGYCPVALTENRVLTLGLPEHRAVFWGKEYHLANSANLAAFQAVPKRYVMGIALRYRDLSLKPMLDAYCPVALVESATLSKGSANYQVYLGGQLFYCSNADARKRLLADPEIIPKALKSYAAK